MYHRTHIADRHVQRPVRDLATEPVLRVGGWPDEHGVRLGRFLGLVGRAPHHSLHQSQSLGLEF